LLLSKELSPLLVLKYGIDLFVAKTYTLESQRQLKGITYCTGRDYKVTGNAFAFYDRISRNCTAKYLPISNKTEICFFEALTKISNRELHNYICKK